MELQKILKEIQEKLTTSREMVDPEGLQEKIEACDVQIADPNFWNDSKKAGQVQKDRKMLMDKLQSYTSLVTGVASILELLELVEEGTDEYQEVVTEVEKIEQDMAAFEVKLLLSDPYDTTDAYIYIHAGTGGTDAMDWAEILLRQYTRYFESQGWRTTIMETSPGEEAGYKSVSMLIEGEYVYGKMKCEHGVHRLVRNSPFNSKGLRQTSFAMLEVVPKLDLDEEVDIENSDLRIDTFRAQGAGGQHVNTTDSAVRITHLPTGIVVQCQNERSQIQNRHSAMTMLMSKLVQLRMEKNLETVNELKGESKQASWGNQIRSYVYSPYTLVKDHRTSHETAQVQEVVDGALEEFIQAKLRFTA
jgi:peptide chain release factor 2